MSVEFKVPPPAVKLDGLLSGEERFCRSFVLGGEASVLDAYAKAYPETPLAKIAGLANRLIAEDRIQDAIALIRIDNENAPVRLLWNKAQRAQEAHQREKRLGLGTRDIENQVDRGTPETRAKRKYDVIDRLNNAGSLRAEHVAAAKELEGTWRALSLGLSSGSRPLDGTVVDQTRGSYQHPMERMTQKQHRIYARFYLPWANEVSRNWIQGVRGRANWLELARRVVVDNDRPRAIEAEIGVDTHTCRKALVKALWRYAQINGTAPNGMMAT